MNRIRNLFKKDKDKLIVFLTAGYPEISSTEKLVLTAVESGADMIEIGIPFSDPQADGPIIQKASEKALSNGITLDIIFQQVKSIRKKTNIPISLMGYYNPIYSYGVKNITILDKNFERLNYTKKNFYLKKFINLNLNKKIEPKENNYNFVFDLITNDYSFDYGIKSIDKGAPASPGFFQYVFQPSSRVIFTPK